MPDRVKPSFVIFDIRALWRSLSPERQSARMSKIKNDGLTQPGRIGCVIAVWQQWALKGWASMIWESRDNIFERFDRRRVDNISQRSKQKTQLHV